MQSYMSYFTRPARKDEHRPFRRPRPEDLADHRGPGGNFPGSRRVG